MQSSPKHVTKKVIIEMICPSDVPAFSKTDPALKQLLTNLNEDLNQLSINLTFSTNTATDIANRFIVTLRSTKQQPTVLVHMYCNFSKVTDVGSCHDIIQKRVTQFLKEKCHQDNFPDISILEYSLNA